MGKGLGDEIRLMGLKSEKPRCEGVFPHMDTKKTVRSHGQAQLSSALPLPISPASLGFPSAFWWIHSPKDGYEKRDFPGGHEVWMPHAELEMASI